ncbi:single stranded DNA-binding protein [Mycobacteroides abscessus subsp. abscessus]|nr:single stranded DNA-binding protein [Mycobacteroides abscessus subsp. abscessus]
MLNRTVIAGRLTKDPILKQSQGGHSVVSFTVAFNRTFTNQLGERETDYINCVAWKSTADNLVKHTRKGSLIGVDGKLQTRSYEGEHGKRIFVTEVRADSVQFLESKKEERELHPANHQGPSGRSGRNQQNYGNSQQHSEDPFAPDGYPIDDDDLPF